jgi:hypothetical protein
LEITHAFGIEMNKDVVRRVLTKYFRPRPGSGGPSWLTFIGHAKDSLWSVDFFPCESILGSDRESSLDLCAFMAHQRP